MRKTITIAFVIGTLILLFNPPTAAAAVNIRRCEFNTLQPRIAWSDDEVKRTVTCFANKFGVSLGMAHYIAYRESRYQEGVYNGTCCGGVYQHHLRYWSARADAFPDWQRWMHINSDCWCNPRINVFVTMKMVQRAGWGPWT